MVQNKGGRKKVSGKKLKIEWKVVIDENSKYSFEMDNWEIKQFCLNREGAIKYISERCYEDFDRLVGRLTKFSIENMTELIEGIDGGGREL